MVLRLAFWSALALLLYMAVARPMPGGPEGALSVNDKLVHGFAYASLTVLGLWGRLKTGVVLAVLLLHGALIEVLQAWVPDRTADWRDLLANSVGILVVLTAMFMARRFIR
jgi:VanZ family protein